MLRVILFTAQDLPLGDLSPDEVRALVRHDAVNGEHYIDITTTRELEKGWRIVYRDTMGKWREYVVDGIDQAHAEGAPVGTYRCVWSVQHDLMGVPCDKMPGVQSPVSAQAALDAALSLTSRWVRGTVTQASTAGASMWRMSAWDALGVLVGNWGGEVTATINVGADAVSGRRVNLLAHAGKEQPTRRFEYGADITGIERKVADSPNVSRIIPLGASEQTDTGGNGRKIDITSVNGGVEYLENTAVRDAYRLPDGQGGWEHPTAYVENTEADTPAKLKEWAQANLQSYTVPQVSYTASVAAFEAAGLDAKGIAEGDAVQVVDDAMGLRVEARVQAVEVNELMPTDQKVTIGNISQALPSMLSSLSSKVGKAVETVQIINGDGFNTNGWLERTRERMNAEANATGGYTYITQGRGIRTYDVAVSDPQSGLDANQVVEVKGGTIRIANSKTSSGDWDWKTLLESGHIAADLVTAAHITTGYIGSAGGTFIDLDNDTVNLGDESGTHMALDSSGVAFYGTSPSGIAQQVAIGSDVTLYETAGIHSVFITAKGLGAGTFVQAPRVLIGSPAAGGTGRCIGIVDTGDGTQSCCVGYGAASASTEYEMPGYDAPGILSFRNVGTASSWVIAPCLDELAGTAAGLWAKTGSGSNTRTGAILRAGDGDGSGTSLRLGGGGLTLIGGGEYAENRYALGDLSATNESLLLGADSGVYIETAANTIANRKTWRFTTAGAINLPESGNIIAVDGSSTIGESSGTSFSIVNVQDSTGTYMAQLRSGTDANHDPFIALIARRGSTASGDLKQRGLYVFCDASGTARYTVHDPANFRSAIGISLSAAVTNPSDVIAAASANITVGSVTYRTYAKVAVLKVVITHVNAIAANTGFKVGTVVSGKRPAVMAPMASNNFSGFIDTNGEVHVRNISGATIAAGTNMTFAAVYVLP